MRGRFVNWGCVGPALINLAVAVAIVVGAITLEHHGHRANTIPAEKMRAMTDDALVTELARCQSLGRKAEDESVCISAWAKNRERFFGSHFEPGEASKP